MERVRERAFVGLFVIVAAVLLFMVALSLTGGIGAARVEHRTYFRFSGGLDSGAVVRYGGLNIGRVKHVRVDPADSTRIEIEFGVNPDAPIRTNSVATVSSLGLLADSFLEISPGTTSAPRAGRGSVIASKEAFRFDQLGDALGTLLPQSEAALKSLTDDLNILHTTIDEATDLLNEQNRKNIAGTLSTVQSMVADMRPAVNRILTTTDRMLTDAQPKLSTTLSDLQATAKKMDPLIDNINRMIGTGNRTLSDVDGTLGENRGDIRASVESLRRVMEQARELVGQLNAKLERNSDNLDEALDNVRAATDNLRQLTDTLKTSPTSIIRGTGVKDRKPGDPPR